MAMARALLSRAVAAVASPLSPSRNYFGAAAAADKQPAGLYGIPHLKTAKGFRRFVDEAIQRSDELVDYISRLPPSEEVIRSMDELSNTLCSVVDSAELCRNTHPDKEYVQEANNAAMRIYEKFHLLNTNHNLYNALLKVEQEGFLQTEEAQRAAHYLRHDMEKGGIHLCLGKLERVSQLNIEIAKLGREFNENIVCDPGCVDIFPASHIPKHMQHYFEAIYRPANAGPDGLQRLREKEKEKGFRIRTDSSTLASILKWVPNEQVRKQAYMRGNSLPHANLGVLDKLISARGELAQIMGYKSYAEFATSSNMAVSVNVVGTFLSNLSEVVRDKANKEFQAMVHFKREMGGQMSESVELWDEAYIVGKMKTSVYNLDAAVIASYFPLSQCIEGLKLLAESLFGATFTAIPFAPGESWHADVMKLALCHPQEGDLGYLYLDIYSREGKYPGCAHFTVRGGRRVSASEYQLPIVALLCNFPLLPGSSSPRLNHWDVETLFHEFGHALHSLLSRTNYQHFSGTRVALDFAETPSNLFEYYAWDYRVLRRFAKHYSTGEVIPEKLVEAMNGAKNMFSAMELQQQQPVGGLSTSALVSDLRQRHTCWNHVEGTHWYTRFNHFVNYGAGYYSYLYSKCFASTIWEKVCCPDPLCLSTGHALRTKLLLHGGAKDPSQMLKDLAGDNIFEYVDKGIIPDITSMRNEMGL